MKKVYATHLIPQRDYQKGKWVVVGHKEHKVEVMATAGRYVMVRSPGAMPYVVAEKELRR